MLAKVSDADLRFDNRLSQLTGVWEMKMGKIEYANVKQYVCTN